MLLAHASGQLESAPACPRLLLGEERGGFSENRDQRSFIYPVSAMNRFPGPIQYGCRRW